MADARDDDVIGPRVGIRVRLSGEDGDRRPSRRLRATMGGRHDLAEPARDDRAAALGQQATDLLGLRDSIRSAADDCDLLRFHRAIVGADAASARLMTDVSALYGLRLRTPRLELRLGSRAELEALAEVAKAGIHPPDEMPFAVPWTDASADPGFVTAFVAHHEQTLAAWTPEEWRLNLLAFHEGAPVGAQALRANGYSVKRTVDTGSWLGAPSQGGGLGTEMRAAVLELAFDCLGARSARSGWLEGGAAQSAGVSARLGYREVGTHVERPRGEPVVHHDLLLKRADWTCPIRVELEGVGGCLALFGAAPSP